MQSNKDAPDRISNLCDDVLSRILSLMNVKKAATTSVLSKRWRYLWAASFSRLVFDEDSFPDMKEASFEEMVDCIFHQFPKGLKLEEFCLRFFLTEFSESHIENWLYFAFDAGTVRIELNFLEKLSMLGYCVPIKLFHNSDHVSRFTALRELFLIHANVSDQVFKAILSTCTSLECLALIHNNQLLKAKCKVPHLKLKRLVMDCHFLQSLEIIAPNLVSLSLSYRAVNMISISIEGARPLVNLNILPAFSFNYWLRRKFIFDQFSAHFSHLQSMTLDTTTISETIMAHNKVPSLNNLTTLCLLHDRQIPYNRLAIYMLEASPFLQRSELHLPLRFHNFNYVEDQLDAVHIWQHQKLREIMLSGFKGFEEDMSFLKFIVGHTSVLKSVEVTTKFMDNYEIDREGAFRPLLYKIRKSGKYFEELRSKLLSILPSKISVQLLDD